MELEVSVECICDVSERRQLLTFGAGLKVGLSTNGLMKEHDGENEVDAVPEVAHAYQPKAIELQWDDGGDEEARYGEKGFHSDEGEGGHETCYDALEVLGHAGL